MEDLTIKNFLETVLSEEREQTLKKFSEQINSKLNEIKDEIKGTSQENFEKSFMEIECKMKTVLLMNEEIALKIQNFSETETDLRNEIKELQESNRHLVKNNELLRTVINEIIKNQKTTNIKINMHESILQAIGLNKTKTQESISSTNVKEEDQSTIIEEVETISELTEKPIKLKENESCVILKGNENVSKIEKLIEEKNDHCQQMFISDEKKPGTFIIYDINWIQKNLNIIITACSEICFENIKQFEIDNDIIISNDINIHSMTKTLFNIINNHFFIITNEANVKFENISINGCKHDDYLLNINKKSQLTFCNGCIENNLGTKAIFYVDSSCILRLNDNKFMNNMVKTIYQPSCINSEALSSIIIKKCQFLNHNSIEYVQSAFIIDAKGHLSIIASKFENNISDIIDKNSMIVSLGNSKFQMIDVNILKCNPIHIQNASNINIERCNFTSNLARFSSGSCLQLERCGNIAIGFSDFKKNRTCAAHAGAINFFNNYKDGIVDNCRFEENTCEDNGYGGAIRLYESNVKIKHSTFLNNSAKNGGAISTYNACTVFESCFFTTNDAVLKGGAIFSESGKIDINMSNWFQNNTAKICPKIYYCNW